MLMGIIVETEVSNIYLVMSNESDDSLFKDEYRMYAKLLCSDRP